MEKHLLKNRAAMAAAVKLAFVLWQPKKYTPLLLLLLLTFSAILLLLILPQQMLLPVVADLVLPQRRRLFDTYTHVCQRVSAC